MRGSEASINPRNSCRLYRLQLMMGFQITTQRKCLVHVSAYEVYISCSARVKLRPNKNLQQSHTYTITGTLSAAYSALHNWLESVLLTEVGE